MENQELIFKLGMLEQRIRSLEEQLRAVESAVVDMGSLIIGLDEIKEGKEILSPIGRGIYVNSKVVSEKLKVDIGGRNFVSKNISETKEIIKNQIGKMEEIKKVLIESLNDAEREFNEIIEAEKN